MGSIDIAPGIVYSSDEVCYMGFSDRPIAESYGKQLVAHEFTTGFIVEKPMIVMKSKWELRFHCNKDNANRLAALDLQQELTHPNNKSITDSWLLPVKPIEVVQLSDNIYYSSTDQIAYLGFTNKGRARVYGDYLCGTHTVGSQYHIENKPKYCIGAKYELIIKDISLSHAEKLTKFDLKQDPPKFSYVKAENDKDAFKDVKRKPAPAVKPDEKPIPISELEVADIVHRGRAQDRYEVIGMKRSDDGTLVAECRCLFHSEFKSLERADFPL